MADESAIWQKTGKSNLIKHRSGKYYLSAKVGGRKVRESLDTDKMATALWKRDQRLKELRHSLDGGSSARSIESLEDAVRHVVAGIALDPSKKAATVKYYAEIAEDIIPTIPADPIRQIKPRQLAEWWAGISGKYAPQRANNMLGLVKRAVKLAQKAGALLRDPSLDLKRVKIPRTRLDLPTTEQFAAVIAHMRAERHRTSAAAADWVEFMAYSGLRPAELNRLTWEDIDEQKGEIRVVGGKEGAKNWEERRVPIIPPLAKLITDMRERTSGTGVVHAVTAPRASLKKACEAVGVNPQRLYDLRHLFATVCVQSGVDVPTFAKWLGHKDGGTLAMRTYVHTGEEHSKKSAAKVSF